MNPDRPDISAGPALSALAGLYVVSVLVRGLCAGLIEAPVIFNDEWVHLELARGLAASGSMSWSGTPVNFACWAYPALLAPIAGAMHPIEAMPRMQWLNSPVISTVLPITYGFARELTSRGRALTAAALYMAHLPASPVCKLGSGFMEDYYYRVLPESGFIFGVVAYLEGRPAGLTVAAYDSERFMAAAARRTWPAQVKHIGLALARDPRRFAGLLEARRIGRMLGRKSSREPMGQVLTFAVNPEYRSREFKQRTNILLANLMIKRMILEFRRAGTPRIRTFIDSKNIGCHARTVMRGWTLTRRNVPGWESPNHEYVVPTSNYPGS